MKLEDLRKEYGSQDNRMTAYPIYVQVQELICIGVMKSGYEARCPFGDGMNKTEYVYEGYEGTFESIDEIKKILKSDEENFKEHLVEEFETGWIWHPVEFFLTIKGAEEYIKRNKHNHGDLRTYVSHFERRNYEMRELLSELGFEQTIEANKKTGLTDKGDALVELNPDTKEN